MKKTITLIPVVLGTLALAACGGSKYPSDAQANFTESCKTSGGTQSSCQCALSKIESTVSFKDYIKAEAALATGLDIKADVQDALTDAMAECS